MGAACLTSGARAPERDIYSTRRCLLPVPGGVDASSWRVENGRGFPLVGGPLLRRLALGHPGCSFLVFGFEFPVSSNLRLISGDPTRLHTTSRSSREAPSEVGCSGWRRDRDGTHGCLGALNSVSCRARSGGSLTLTTEIAFTRRRKNGTDIGRKRRPPR